MPLNEAVTRAVNECIKEGILAEFLQQNKSEAIAVSIFEYDEEKELALFRAAEREQGFDLGLEQGLERGLEQGLIALINSLKEYFPNCNALYSKIISNPEYAHLTWEEFEKYL